MSILKSKTAQDKWEKNKVAVRSTIGILFDVLAQEAADREVSPGPIGRKIRSERVQFVDDLRDIVLSAFDKIGS
jgi:hypothetical protein